jgi:hypothetical protein
MDTKGHMVGQGGLRGHSVGKHYPYGVVGQGNPHDGTLRWCVVHIPSGRVVCHNTPVPAPIRSADVYKAQTMLDNVSHCMKHRPWSLTLGDKI